MGRQPWVMMGYGRIDRLEASTLSLNFKLQHPCADPVPPQPF